MRPHGRRDIKHVPRADDVRGKVGGTKELRKSNTCRRLREMAATARGLRGRRTERQSAVTEVRMHPLSNSGSRRMARTGMTVGAITRKGAVRRIAPR